MKALKIFSTIMIGLFIGFTIIYLGQYLSLLVYPFPEGLSKSNHEQMTLYVQSLPPMAFILVILSHAIGMIFSGFITGLVYPQKFIIPSIIGILFTFAGILNIISIPHPQWFAAVDLIIYIPFIILFYWIGSRVRKQKKSLETIED